MKNIKLILISILLITLSCERNDSVPTENLDNSKHTESSHFSRTANVITLYNQIVAIDDTYEQLLIASALSPEEMYQMWLVKIDNFKANNTLNENQSIFLQNLENNLNPNIFIDGSEARINFNFNEKMQEAQSLFGENEGWYLLNKVENINHRIARFRESPSTDIGDSGMEDPIGACECNKDSNCKRITGISLWGVSWENGTCSSGNCYRKTYLFGLIESSNNGRCKY